MKKWCIVVELREFDTNEAGELLGEGEMIEQQIVHINDDEQDAQEAYDQIDFQDFQ